MIIVLIGPPGSGKGTYSQMLARKGNWLHVSMGQLLRNHLKHHGKYSRAVKRSEKGPLVSAKVIMGVLSPFIHTHKRKNLLLDGVPRTIYQAEVLPRILKKEKLQIDAFFYIDANEKLISKRLSSRRQCQKCGKIYGLTLLSKKPGKCDADGGKLIRRVDDDPKIIRNRFRVYYKDTHPLLDWASNKYPVVHINGNNSPEKVVKEMRRAIARLKKQARQKE